MSGKLSCSAGNCVHNMNGLCSANSIHVNGITSHSSSGTDCSTFSEKGFKNAFMNMGNMNIGGEIRQLFNSGSVEMSPKIQCDAVNCMYNANKQCDASNIQIYGPGATSVTGTQCETFRK